MSYATDEGVTRVMQERPLAVYERWKAEVKVSDEDAQELSPPLLISVPKGYETAKHRILFCGQETYGWQWTSRYRDTYPKYDKDFPYADIRTFADFLANDDGVEALCWGYREFNFSSKQPINWRGPFWKAFREAQEWRDASLVWSNLSRCDFRGGSILAAPAALIDELAEMQTTLFEEELCILKPNACIFFSGPYYDSLLSTIFPDVEFAPVDDISIRKLARLTHPKLPTRSFRTYHPGSLSRQKLWTFIEKLQNLIID